MRRISFLITLLWMIISCVFDTTVRLITNLKFEFYHSFMIAASMELPADLFSIVGLTWFGRRWSASLSLLLCGLTMLCCALVKGPINVISIQFYRFVPLERRLLQITVFLLGRFFATYAINVGFQFTAEVMPTCLRAQGIALVNVMSMVALVTSPYIVYSV